VILRKDDRVIITHKNNIEGVIVGFYCNLGTPRAVVRTNTGNEWVVSTNYLRKVANDGG